jgi:hypothetical protein
MPVKRGPLMVLNNGYAGKQIVRMLTDGMYAAQPTLTRAATDTANAASAALSTATVNVPTFGLETALAARLAPAVTAANARATAAERYAGTSATSTASGDTHLYFYGDLSFPNISDPDDAKKFIENLENLGG